jgi:lariat debranching enzyme
MRVCIEGCAHGDLDNIYSQIAINEERTGEKVDLLICCGEWKKIQNFHEFLNDFH